MTIPNYPNYSLPTYSLPAATNAGDVREVTPTVRTEATVTVSEAVNGKPRRKRRTRRRARNGTVETVKVQKRVMAAARKALRPGERIVPVSETRVDILH